MIYKPRPAGKSEDVNINNIWGLEIDFVLLFI